MARKQWPTKQKAPTEKYPELNLMREHLTAQTKITYPEHNAQPRDVWRLRCSALPVCPLQFVYKRLVDTVLEDLDFYGKYYTSLGTLAHALMQDQFGRGERIFGDYKCRACGNTDKNQVYAPCSKCNSEHMEYVELEVSLGKYLSGHVDGVINLGTKKNPKWWILDYKTSSTKNNEEHRRTGSKYPYLHNVSQIKAYSSLVSKCFGLDIQGWVLVYVARDSLTRDFCLAGEHVTKSEKASILEDLTLLDRLHGQAIKLYKTREWKYAQRLIKHKPCKNKLEYLEKHHDNFNPCPLAESGACFDKAKLKETMENAIKGKKTRKRTVI